MTTNPKLLRLIDANLNRLREGLRVLEDLCRFVYDAQELASKIKDLRHMCRISPYEKYLFSRDSDGDVLRSVTTQSEQSRSDLSSVILSNIKRAQESARVLEESLKIESLDEAIRFKALRYALYSLEKELFLLLPQKNVTSNSK